MIIKDNIKEILKQWTIKENMYFLPKIQLDRKDYIECNSILETIWLNWNKWKKAHISDLTNEDLKNAFEDIIESWEVETLKETIKKFQFYPTPKEIAEYLIELADIKEDEIVCEPSAWLWNIADEIKTWKLTLVEFDFAKCEELLKKWYTPINSDFLIFNWTFDKIVWNPPFCKSQDVKHILHMYELLNKWWRVVSVASSSIQTRQGKLYDELKALNPEFIDLDKWSFKESGTMVNGCIVILNKPL